MPKLPTHDPDGLLTRKGNYMQLERKGEMQEAIWEALECLTKQGFDLGPKFEAVALKRQQIKNTTK